MCPGTLDTAAKRVRRRYPFLNVRSYLQPRPETATVARDLEFGNENKLSLRNPVPRHRTLYLPTNSYNRPCENGIYNILGACR